MSSDFDAFISYNSKDKTYARDLKRILEARKLSIWFDEDQIRPGSLFQPLLEKGLQSSGCIIIALGSSGVGPWQDEETQLALNIARTLQRPLIPVLLPGFQDASAIAGFLGARSRIDFRQGYSDEEISRLIWGITGEKLSAQTGIDQPLSPNATKWILVAGSGGRTPCPASIEEVSRNLGAALATARFSLVTGGWNGVDHIVARAFATQIQQTGQALSGRLRSVGIHRELMTAAAR
jgi:hypothetical protein